MGYTRAEELYNLHLGVREPKASRIPLTPNRRLCDSAAEVYPILMMSFNNTYRTLNFT